MIEVNPYYLHAMLGPFAGLADDDEAVIKYGAINPNDEYEIKNLIRTSLKPNFKCFNEQSQQLSKQTLQYYLSKPTYNFERVFDSLLPPFDHPDEARNFFLWVWDELFPEENYRVKDITAYVEIIDINASNTVKLRSEKNGA